MSQLYLAFDTETGGLNENKVDILTSYFAIVTEDHQIIDELDLRLKPDNGRLPIAEAGALAVNKIDIGKHIEDSQTISYSEGKQKLVALIKKHLKRNGRFSNILPMGYNVPFDTRFVQKHLLDQETWESLLHYKSHDVMASVDFLKKCGWFPKTLGSLSTVVEYLGVAKRDAHSAKEDILMTIDVDKKIMDIMKSKKDAGSSGPGTDLISLLEAE